ncbi:MAG: PQQ-like beta-propeller repeat protein [Verrucomicrobiales bacterium]|nr:PQQ-like beta-propeller repeat protein [Verrucomicrobiales bacterium]
MARVFLPPRPVPAWAPVAAGLVLLLVWVGWLLAPVRTPVDLRVPGRDRPAGESAAGEVQDAFAKATVVAGPGKPAAIPGAWPRFRGAGFDGVQRDAKSLTRAWGSAGPKTLWSVEVGEGFAGPAVDGGRVYLMDYDRERQRDALRCLSLEDGAEIWRFSYPMAVKRNHGLTRTVPCVANGRVVAMGPKCHVVAVDARTGAFAWGLDLARDFGTTVPPWYAGQCPWVDGDVVVLAPGGAEALLMGVDIRTGKVSWKTPNPRGWKMTHASVVPMDWDGGRWYLYPASGGIAAVDAKDGSLAWDSTVWKINIATVPTPVVLGEGRVFLTGGYGAGSMLLQFRRVDGKLDATPVWRVKPDVFGATQHTPVWDGRHLYGIRADGRLVCLGLDGKVVWAGDAGATFGLGPLMMADGLILALSEGGRLDAVEASPDGYRRLASASILEAHEAWAPLALAGERLLARDLTRMVCLDLGR